jgi:hypothetical protein
LKAETAFKLNETLPLSREGKIQLEGDSTFQHLALGTDAAR